MRAGIWSVDPQLYRLQKLILSGFHPLWFPHQFVRSWLMFRFCLQYTKTVYIHCTKYIARNVFPDPHVPKPYIIDIYTKMQYSNAKTMCERIHLCWRITLPYAELYCLTRTKISTIILNLNVFYWNRYTSVMWKLPNLTVSLVSSRTSAQRSGYTLRIYL